MRAAGAAGCACRPGWTGATCGQLDLKESSPALQLPNATWTWGGSPIVGDDGEIWCYYNALRMPGSIEMYRRFNRCKELFRLGIDQRHFDDAGALSLAKLPRDRFVSIDGDEIGTIITRPF